MVAETGVECKRLTDTSKPPAKYFCNPNGRINSRMFHKDFPELKSHDVREIQFGKTQFVVSVSPDCFQAVQTIFSTISWVKVEPTSIIPDWDPE